MDSKNNGEKLSEALLKVALGYQIAEVTEEYAEVDGQLKLTKRKRTKKDVPPDLKAVQMLLGESGDTGVESMSDKELEEERARLIATLERAENTKVVKRVKTEKGAGQVFVEDEKKPRPKPRKRVVRRKKEEME